MNEPVSVTSLDDQRLICEGESAVDRYNKNLDDARVAVLPMARGLLAARRKYPADRDFGDWLHTSSYREIGKDDRAALIKIGEHDSFSEKFLRTTSLVSPQTIWDAIRDLQSTPEFQDSIRKARPVLAVSYDTKPTEDIPQSSETDAAPSTTPVEPLSPVSQVTKKATPRHDIIISGNKVMKDPSKADLIHLLNITPEQFVAVISAYPAGRQYTIKAEFAEIARKRGRKDAARDVFLRAVEVVKAGKAPALSNNKAFDARIVLPDVPKGFCGQFDLLKLVQNIDKLELLNSRAAELTAAGISAFDIHNELQHIWQNGVVKPQQAPKVVALAPDDSKNQIKHPVKYCGEVIWPHDSLKHVTYKDLNMGWHIADHLLKYFEVAKPQKPNEVLVEVMQLVQDLRAASSLVGVTDTITACVQAYAKRNQRKDKADLSDGMPPGRPR